MSKPVAAQHLARFRKNARAYGDDLAYVHDAGFTVFARMAGRELLKIFRRHGIKEGLVVDIGCGTGVLARILTAAGYRVLGIDISPSMLKLARRQASAATFRRGSLFDASIPNCEAITCTGECINYLFDSTGNLARLKAFFSRAYDALRPGGIFAFDFLHAMKAGTRTRMVFRTGSDWVVLVNLTEDRSRQKLTREITTFRRVGSLYRRSDEIHISKIYSKGRIPAMLRRLGFFVKIQRGYGAEPLRPGHVVVLARRRSRPPPASRLLAVESEGARGSPGSWRR